MMISSFRFLGIRCQFGCFDFSCFLMIRLISFSFIKPLFWYQAVFADLCTIIEAFCILTNCINSFTWYFFQHPYHEGVNKISVIAPLYLEPVVVLARKKSGIESVYDLENRRVCTGPKESGTKETSDDLLKFYGLKKVTRVPEFFHDNSNHNDINSCDAGIIVMGLRGPCFKEIGKTDMRVLELPYAQVLAESKAFLTEFTLPEGVFARHPSPTLPHKNIQTVAYTALLAVREDASSALVNEVLGAI
ncbi:MAG: hypothetical protein D3903_14805 [Candidatus Electrothrix sp. GM3_4]|nr:hypothetical protein [Candidatus Electrothrix sp. GM3_4]